MFVLRSLGRLAIRPLVWSLLICSVAVAGQSVPDPRLDQAIKALSSANQSDVEKGQALLVEMAQVPSLRPVVIDALLQPLKLDAPRAQSEAQKAMIDTLAIIGDSSAAPRLMEIMESPTVYFLGLAGGEIPLRDVHAQAALALGKLNDAAAIPRLRRRLADEKETDEVKKAAAESLVALGGKFQDTAARAGGLLCLGRWDELKTLPISAFRNELIDSVQRSFNRGDDDLTAKALKLLRDIRYQPRPGGEANLLAFFGPNYLDLRRLSEPALGALEKALQSGARSKMRMAEIRYRIGRPMPVRLTTQTPIETVKTIATGLPVDLNWVDRERLCFRLADVVGRAFGVEVVRYVELNVTDGKTTSVESPRAWLKRSRDWQMEASLWAKYAFGWDSQGRQVDHSSFEIKFRRGNDEWRRGALLAHEPRFFDLSPEGSHIVVDSDETGVVQVIDLSSGTTRKISGAIQARFGEASYDLYYLTDGEGPRQIRRLNLQSGVEQTIAEPFRPLTFALSSDLKIFAYEAHSTSGRFLYVVRAGTGKEILITPPDASDSSPVMSPDGQSLTFVRLASGNVSICRLNLSSLPTTVEPPKSPSLAPAKKAGPAAKPVKPTL